MRLWKVEHRSDLIAYLGQHDLMNEPAFWKLAQALFEVLPRNDEDWRNISALLSERESLQNEAKRAVPVMRDLFLHIADHPELLTDEAIEMFETLVRQAKLERHPGFEEMIDRHELLLEAHKAVSGGYWEMVLADARRGS
jgi:hypothetical protein